MSSRRNPEEILEELEQLDKRLAELQTFLKASKTGNVGDSLLTKSNVENAIHLLEEVNPEEKNMVAALKSLLPLAEKNDEELKEKPKEVAPALEGDVNGSRATPERTSCTSKLKTRMSPHKII